MGSSGGAFSVACPGALAELEWNPFSTASRAARADRSGRTGEALRLYVKAGQYDRVRECLLCSLPKGPVTSQLVEAATEWVALRRSLELARDQRLPDGWTDWFAEEVDGAADVLWRSADGQAAASRHRFESPRLREGLRREGDKLARVAQSLREARSALAELALSRGGQPTDMQKPERRLRDLAAAVRDLEQRADAAQA